MGNFSAVYRKINRGDEEFQEAFRRYLKGTKDGYVIILVVSGENGAKCSKEKELLV